MTTGSSFILLFLILSAIVVVVGFVFFVVKRMSGAKPTQSTPIDAIVHPDTALNDLKRRFVEGEIDEEEYKRIKEVLEE